MTEVKDDAQTESATETAASSPAPAAKTNGGGKKAAVKAKSNKKAAKAKSKPAKKPAKKTASPQAQSGEPIELPFDKMNKAEQKIVSAVYTKQGERKPFTIKDIMKATGLKSSPVRNGVRRPVRGGWIEGVDRGTYRLTEKARKRGLKSA